VATLVFYSALYRAALVPRWIAGFGIVCVVLMLAGITQPFFGNAVVLSAPRAACCLRAAPCRMASREGLPMITLPRKQHTIVTQVVDRWRADGVIDDPTGAKLKGSLAIASFDWQKTARLLLHSLRSSAS
jgi:hypothetical protein